MTETELQASFEFHQFVRGRGSNHRSQCASAKCGPIRHVFAERRLSGAQFGGAMDCFGSFADIHFEASAKADRVLMSAGQLWD